MHCKGCTSIAKAKKSNVGDFTCDGDNGFIFDNSSDELEVEPAPLRLMERANEQEVRDSPTETAGKLHSDDEEAKKKVTNSGQTLRRSTQVKREHERFEN